MSGAQVNRASYKMLIGLSLLALGMVVSGYWQPPQTDEGAAAHIFQLAMGALAPTILLFLATADWKQPRQRARALVLPGAMLAVAFGALYYLEHYR